MLLAGAIVLGIGWLLVEFRSPHPLIDMRMMKIPAVWTTNLVALLFGIGMYATFAFLPEFLQTPSSAGYGFGASITESGLILLPMTITMFAAGVASGGLARRFGSKQVLIAGSVISALPFVLLATAHSEKWEILLAMAILGGGFGMAFAAMSNLIVAAVPPEQTGVASGMNANIRTIGGSIGAAVMASIDLGASLAHGGCVVDDGIQCPFHGWVWAPDGHNVSIPYQDRPNRARSTSGTWPVVERNESVYVWFDHSGREPLWDVPDALDGVTLVAGREFHPAWPDGRQHYRDLRIHPQMVVENAVDPHHFRFVHHTAISPVLLRERVEGHEWWARVGFGRGWRDHARDASGALRTDTRNTIDILWSGMGVSVNVEHMAEGVRVITINITPVEDGRTEIFATYWIGRRG